MDEIVCANTAFRYWRCPPQVRELYPRLPNSEDGWRALPAPSQLRRRLASSIPIALCSRRPQDPDYRCSFARLL